MRSPKLIVLVFGILTLAGQASAQTNLDDEIKQPVDDDADPVADSDSETESETPQSRETDGAASDEPSGEHSASEGGAAVEEISDPGPALPEGMTLDEVLDLAARPPPEHFPDAIHDDRILAFFLADQLEYRFDGKEEPDVLGWEANFWVGGDFNRLWLKPEGEASFHSPGSVETETDVLYSRLIFPFWSAQVGFQYANEWSAGEPYEDRWSGAVAFQGLAPGKFEVDASAYISEKADVTAVLELEYDWRITQRLVAQPRTELSFAFQDVAERNLGAGLTDVVAGLRVRYEFLREFAPYLGIRYEGRVFESAARTRSGGEPVWRFFGVAGLRFALL